MKIDDLNTAIRVDPMMLRNRIGALAANAVQELRAVVGRGNSQIVDADIAAIKSIEAILETIPHEVVIDSSEALPLVPEKQPEVNPALNSIRGMLLDQMEEELSSPKKPRP